MPITLSDFYKNKFGRKVYKLAVDAGCTCPTRDGTLDTRGCIFCSANGSGDFIPPKNLPIAEQLERAKLLVQKKAHGRGGPRVLGVDKVSAEEKSLQSQNAPLLGQPKNLGNCQKLSQDQNAPRLSAGNAAPAGNTVSAPAYIAYFQNFTNTYGDPLVLKQKYLDALAAPDIMGVDIATRPDCLGPEILEVIKELSQKTFVTVELGLQSVHQKTADWMRRGYPTSVYFDAVAALKKECPAVHIVTQLILGLPGEDDDDMLESVRRVVAAGSDGIKLTVLYVLAGTDLEKEWRAGNFECLAKEKYFELLKKIVPLLPPDMVAHRLTGDGPKKILLAPDWTKNKRQVLNELAALHLM
ncbi:MAG: TIGR01212 family radical SAM protein [Treponema sp.]|nr:TIGR01212 family radical SAM protein [Treponema sp.]